MPLPPYLVRDNYEVVRARANRVSVVNASITDVLAAKPAASVDRFVLLDAQDWMTDIQLNDLWREITRTAAPGARVIFVPQPNPACCQGVLFPTFSTAGTIAMLSPRPACV